jgi:hypothetical protein
MLKAQMRAEDISILGAQRQMLAADSAAGAVHAFSIAHLSA